MLKMTRNGQITIPKELRTKWHLEEGTLFEAESTDDGILFRPLKLVVKKYTYKEIIGQAEKDFAEGNYTEVSMDQLGDYLHGL